MKNKKKTFALLLAGLCFLSASSQRTPASEATDNSVKTTNFSVPSSVAFNLLGVNPSAVHRPGFARDFKFDWLVKDNKIISNLAVEAQPLWLFFYKNTDYQKLSRQNAAARILSSLTLSLGTAAKDSLRSLAWGAKVNLYAAKNPIYDTAYIARVGQFFTNSALENQVFAKQFECDNTSLTTAQKARCQKELDSLKKEYNKELEANLADVEKYKEQYQKENWNTTIIDLGFGKIYNYLSTTLDSLSFSDGGEGAWLSGSFGIGKKVLVNAMVKYTALAKNKVATLGANIRYGGVGANFFVEGLYQTAAAANAKNITIAYGGDIRFKTFTLQFGLRTDYTKDLTFRYLIPIVNFNYLMNQ